MIDYAVAYLLMLAIAIAYAVALLAGHAAIVRLVAWLRRPRVPTARVLDAAERTWGRYR